MSSPVIAYASSLQLSRSDIKTLAIKDAYALHKVVYGLFEDVRSDEQKKASVGSGILYADKGGDFQQRQILMVSDRKPHQTPQFGKVQTKPIIAAFLEHDRYAFEVTVNPTKRENQSRKIIPLRGQEAIKQWLVERASASWGFAVNPDNLEVVSMGVQTFEKEGQKVVHGSATLKGELTVTDRTRFHHSFTHGIGRGRSFGFGLLQIVPLTQ